MPGVAAIVLRKDSNYFTVLGECLNKPGIVFLSHVKTEAESPLICSFVWSLLKIKKECTPGWPYHIRH